jgi:hypothetical protein
MKATEYGQRKVNKAQVQATLQNVHLRNIILIKYVSVLANNTGSGNTSSRWTDLEIVINHKCRVVSNYPSRYPYTDSIKYGRTTNFALKHINKKKDIKMLLSGIKC